MTICPPPRHHQAAIRCLHPTFWRYIHPLWDCLLAANHTRQLKKKFCHWHFSSPITTYHHISPHITTYHRISPHITTALSLAFHIFHIISYAFTREKTISSGCQHPSARSLLHQLGLLAPPLPGPWNATDPVPVPAHGKAWHHRITRSRPQPLSGEAKC